MTYDETIAYGEDALDAIYPGLGALFLKEALKRPHKDMVDFRRYFELHPSLAESPSVRFCLSWCIPRGYVEYEKFWGVLEQATNRRSPLSPEEGVKTSLRKFPEVEAAILRLITEVETDETFLL